MKANQENIMTKIYIVIINKELKKAFIKQKTEKNCEALKLKYECDKGNFYKPLKVRALSTDDAFLKACNALDLDSQLFEIDKTRVHQLEEIEEFTF